MQQRSFLEPAIVSIALIVYISSLKSVQFSSLEGSNSDRGSIIDLGSVSAYADIRQFNSYSFPVG